MLITLNGKEKSLNENTTLIHLIEELGIADKRIAVEINHEIIPKSKYANYAVRDGDTIEIVHAIGGG
ncbi:MAG: sulfur carrier protein ThiS [Gammaproteobacteria bacterium]|nr:sulfur carrier protein ThiS [Gammaproteobacteria bacterium]